MKKWIFLIILSFSLFGYSQDQNVQWFQQDTVSTGSKNQDPNEKSCFCNKRCFSFCKQKAQAVSDCVITNKTTVSFSVDCHCRALKTNEILPAFYQTPNSCLIKPAQAAY